MDLYYAGHGTSLYVNQVLCTTRVVHGSARGDTLDEAAANSHVLVGSCPCTTRGQVVRVFPLPVFAKKTVLRDVGCTLVAHSPCHPSVQCCREARTEPFAKNTVFFASRNLPRPRTNIELRGCKGSVQPMCTQHREALFFSQTPVST